MPYATFLPCPVEGCTKRVKARGLCEKHDARMKSHGSTDYINPRNRLVHGHSLKGEYDPTYNTWQGMISRCTNPNHDAFARYGGRGILICTEWFTFANFLSDMGPRPEGLTLDRKNNDGNYEPTNCGWATAAEQARNRRRPRRPVAV